MPKTIGVSQKQLLNKNEKAEQDPRSNQEEQIKKQDKVSNPELKINKLTENEGKGKKSTRILPIENTSNSDIYSARTLSNVSQQNMATKMANPQNLNLACASEQEKE